MKINQHCRRRFYADGSATAQVFAAQDAWTVYVPDISTTTGLVVKTDTTDDGTFDTTWDSGDYELRPLNARGSSGESWPYTSIHAVEARCFPVVGKRAGRVQVTADWGWPAVPDAIPEACLILAARFYRRGQSPEGVIGFGDFGPMRLSRTDPDIAALLDPYCAVGVLR